MAARYGFRIIGSPIKKDARCQRCDSVDISNFSIARAWKWLGDREPPNTPRYRFENFQKYAKSDERGLYLTARGGIWRLEPDFLPFLVEQQLRPPYSKQPLSVTQKYNKADSSDSDIEFLCQVCRRRKRSQVERENRRLGKVRKATRQEVLERDDYRCVSCGEADERLEVDHITSVAEGGNGSLANLQVMCGDCHLQKTYRASGRPWWNLRGPSRIRGLRLPYFEVEAHPCSVGGREGISLLFLYTKRVSNKAYISYEIIPSVPIPYGLEGFRDLCLYHHGSEPGNAVFCKSTSNTLQGLQELRSDIDLLGAVVLTEK